MFSSKYLSRIACVIALLSCKTLYAQQSALPNCGVNSAVTLGRLLNANEVKITQLQSESPNETVSLLDVKRMCEQTGLTTVGVKASFQDLIDKGIPCIIGLSNPSHFTVLLDGKGDYVRLLEANQDTPHLLVRSEVEKRFTGYALVPQIDVPSDSPHLQMPRFDQYQTFGGIGQKVDYHFPLSNTGKTPLVMEIASTSCGCTAAVLQGTDPKKLTLAPGAKSEVVISYAVQSQAPIQQMATLHTNDPRRPIVYLSIRGELPPQLTLSPPALYVAQNRGEEPNKSFKVIGPKGTAIEKVWSDLPFLSFDIGQREEDGERIKWPVKVQGFADAPIGSLGGKINVRLADGKEVFVSVRGNIEGTLPNVADAALLPRAEDDPHTPIGSPLPTIKVGQLAPDFTATDMNGKTWKLSELLFQLTIKTTGRFAAKRMIGLMIAVTRLTFSNTTGQQTEEFSITQKVLLPIGHLRRQRERMI